MSLLNSVLGGVFDILLLPFRSLPPMIGLVVISALCSVGMLLGYKATSNQPAIEAVKRKIAAGLFEIRLYNDDIVAILKAQGAILRDNLRYLGLNMVPMVFMMVPFVLVIAQLQFHYGYEGLEANEPVLLQVTLQEGASSDVSLELPDGVRLDAPAVRMAALPGTAWRLVPESSGSYELGIIVGSERLTKTLVVDDTVTRRSPFRLAPSFLNQLLYPAEPPLPADSAAVEIALHYPDRELSVLGFGQHWLVWFFLLTIVLAFAMKGWFGVTI
ncbi:MAG: hypothetical protein GKS06_16050 [Acidobacteria bacterium]|nr:hypothetical protein [Acidobacteriota bacterium]